MSGELMRDSAVLARDKGVMMHTHLAENAEDIAYSLEVFGCRPGEYAERLGWVGPDVWHAHCVKLDAGEIDLFARTGTAVAHCPCSNCRLGSGIAPVRAMRDAGVTVGLGVDGSASNDQANLAQEARQAMLLQRVAFGADKMSAREALEIATLGGAKALGRSDVGRIRTGMRADQVAQLAVTLCADGANHVSGQIFSVRGNEVVLFSQPRPVKSVSRMEGWPPETLIEQGLSAMEGSFTDLGATTSVFPYPPG